MTSLHRNLTGAYLSPEGSVVTVGAFDGVHLGHQAVLRKVRERARELGLVSVVITFEPLPREFFARSEVLPLLSSAREKFEIIRNCGIDHVLMLRFSATLAAMSAEEFVSQILIGRLAVREIWIGEDFRFGQARRGDLALLRNMGASNGFQAETIAPFRVNGERISSSGVRMALAQDDYTTAQCLLGRSYSISGKVVRGQQLGRKLGYPTANLRLHRRKAAVEGIFAVRVHGVESWPMPGVASLGTRPTVNGIEPLLEAHLFDFDGDIYGQRIEVEFVKKLRNEKKFENLGLMVEQIDHDADQARNFLDLTPLKKSGA